MIILPAQYTLHNTGTFLHMRLAGLNLNIPINTR
jgi:hypothetical protein